MKIPTFDTHRIAAAAAMMMCCAVCDAQSDSTPPTTAAPAYTSIRIAQPDNGSTVLDNNGLVKVQIVLTPAIALRTGDRFVVLLDGKPVEKNADADYQLKNLDRGTHTLLAKVENGNGDTVVQSDAVQFNMWEASKLFPNREK